MSSKIAHLIIHDTRQSQKSGEIFIDSLPENPESYVIVVIEIDSKKAEDQQFIEQFLAATIAAFESSKLTTAEKTLENILYRLNDEVPNLLPKNKRWLEKFHCLVAIFEQGHLYFSTFGKIRVYLIKPTSIKSITTKPEEVISKIFSFTLSGEIKNDDRILITNENLINFLSLDKIKKTVSTLPPKSAIAHLGNMLQATSPEISFFSVILQASNLPDEVSDIERPPLTKLAAPTTSKNSLDQLITVENETTKILTPPSIFHSVKESLKQRSYFGWLKKIKFGNVPKFLINLLNRLFKLFPKMANGLKNLWPYLKSFPKLKESIKNRFTKISQWFIKLSKVNKALIVMLAVILLVFSQNLIWQGKQQAKIKNQAKYQQILGEIESKRTGIEAALIYNDTFRAKQLLSDINGLIAQMPKDTNSNNTQYQDTIKKIKDIANRVWHVNNIADPAVITDFQSVNQTADLKQISAANRTLYAVGSNNQLFTVNLDTKETKQLTDNSVTLLNPKNSSQANQIIANTADNKFYSIVDGKITELTVKLPSSLQQINDLDFYYDKMYLLDKASNQIYRLTQSGKNFGLPKTWVSDKTSVQNGVSMAIDGAVYVLTDSGQIIRFNSGKKNDLAALTVDPALTSAQQIFTGSDLKNMYILDKQNKRIVSFDKQGNLQNQYYSDKFDDLKSIFVNEKDKKIYILNSQKIFLINL